MRIIARLETREMLTKRIYVVAAAVALLATACETVPVAESAPIRPDAITPRMQPVVTQPAGDSAVGVHAPNRTEQMSSEQGFAAGASAPGARRRKPLNITGTGVLVMPRPLRDAAPAAIYPPKARLEGREGEAVVRVAIDETGVPFDLVIEESSGHHDLDASALKAAMSWRFSPATWQGAAIEYDVLVPFRFELRQPAKLK